MMLATAYRQASAEHATNAVSIVRVVRLRGPASANTARPVIHSPDTNSTSRYEIAASKRTNSVACSSAHGTARGTVR